VPGAASQWLRRFCDNRPVEPSIPTIVRPRWRRRLIKVFVGSVLALQVGLAINGYRDPHKFFAFQPFNESSTWSAEIVRVTWDGRRLPVDQSWDGYRWDSLVAMPAIEGFTRTRHASYGIDATIAFLDDALDWVATHTPADHETRYLEATVTYPRNTRGPSVTVLRSVEREPT
jgi:hypothetical protein